MCLWLMVPGIVVRHSLTLGRALRDARRARWTQRELAEQAGVWQPTIANVERGTGNVSLETLWRLLAMLELDITIEPRRRRDAASLWDPG